MFKEYDDDDEIKSVKGKYLYPVTVGVVDEVKPHVVVLVADATHFLVESPGGLVVARYAKTQVELTLSQIVRLRMVAEPGKFKLEVALCVLQIDNLKSTFRAVNLAAGCQAECLAIKLNATFKVRDIDVEVVKFSVNFHIPLVYRAKIVQGERRIKAKRLFWFFIRAVAYLGEAKIVQGE